MQKYVHFRLQLCCKLSRCKYLNKQNQSPVINKIATFLIYVPSVYILCFISFPVSFGDSFIKFSLPHGGRGGNKSFIIRREARLNPFSVKLYRSYRCRPYRITTCLAKRLLIRRPSGPVKLVENHPNTMRLFLSTL